MRNKQLSKQHLVLLVGFLMVMATASCGQNLIQPGVDKRSLVTTMYQKYAQEFPQVKSITVEQLQKLQQQEKKIVLVDVRPLKERKVSIIPGAISIKEFEDNMGLYRDSNTMVVAYCTIGYRSGKYAQRLFEQGIDIFNLEGSLLAWSHVQGELVNDGGKTKTVHVFGRQWKLAADNYQPVW